MAAVVCGGGRVGGVDGRRAVSWSRAGCESYATARPAATISNFGEADVQGKAGAPLKNEVPALSGRAAHFMQGARPLAGTAERRAKSLGARSWVRRERNSEQPVATQRLDSIRRQKARSRVRQRWGYSISLRMVLHSVGSKNSTPQSTAQSIPPRLISPNRLQIRHTSTR